ncbi:hypothetical protein GOBAR_AA10303 [Gossypium barbadense]|uniref:DNA mismatch repair protein Mlh1 C-terminal domain-containing protein n=1 Tax=Gossypium barbadense TaxID=3634 RepID=A0A2P5Y477_GOSBA|nr:hypothetical protein GOBAR_AA10303 [Gossypium barbadense]
MEFIIKDQCLYKVDFSIKSSRQNWTDSGTSAFIKNQVQVWDKIDIEIFKELMYQQVLRRFAHFNAIQLSEPAPLQELIMLALKEEDSDLESNENDDLKKKIAEGGGRGGGGFKPLWQWTKLGFWQMNTQLLNQKSEMLEEYFCIFIDSDGNLSRLPILLDQYTPDMDRVPEFVLCLGNDVGVHVNRSSPSLLLSSLVNFSHWSPTSVSLLFPQVKIFCIFITFLSFMVKVEWEEEKNCFQSLAAALGNFYAMHPPMLPNPSGKGLEFYRKRKHGKHTQDGGNSCHVADGTAEEDEFEHELLSEAETAWAQREWSIQHVLFPSMRLFLKPPNSMASNGTFVRPRPMGGFTGEALQDFRAMLVKGAAFGFVKMLRKLKDDYHYLKVANMQ